MLASLVMAAGMLFVSSTARAANNGGTTRVGPGVYLTKASAVQGPGTSEQNSPSNAEPRIVGGHPIDISQAPWQAALTLNPAIYLGNSFERQFCGGSLVTSTLIISAAHCMFDPRTGAVWADGELAAVTGRTQLSSSQGQEIPVSRFFLFTDGQGNPLFNGQSSAWDISIVELEQPSSSPTIKVAGADETELWAVGRRADVTGWGATSFQGEGSDFLLSTELTVLPEANCTRSVGPGFDPATSICAGVYSGIRDSCQGDSGGPLVAPTADGGARLVGDVQSGFECGRSNNPAAYGRLGNAALELSGIDIYGSGAQPPTILTRTQALELAFIRADSLCGKDRKCRAFNARGCRPRGAGFRCVVENFLKTRRLGKFRCFRKVLWTANTGTIERDNLNKEKCKPGW
jgi:hypothetical protein